MIYQWVIVRQNCETFVAWAETEAEALETFRQAGHSDAWKVLRKRAMPDQPWDETHDRGY